MKNYRKTVLACYLGSISQAIIANFITLLFFRFHEFYSISYGKLALIPTTFFFAQIIVDIFCAKFVDLIGQRICIVVSEILSGVGLILLAILPNVMPNPFIGIIISVIIYAIGSGLIEVLASPIIEACPFEHKDKVMSVLHSFYCWGVVGTIVISTIFFNIFGIEKWPILACLFAIIPLFNIYNYATCPIESVTGEDKGLSIINLFKIPSFWISLILMICAGACELSMAQWASTFVESSLNVSKSISDLVGPALFATTMGLSRIIYGKFGGKMKLEIFMIVSGILCLGCYLVTSLVHIPAISLIGCVVCGFSVGIMWPGTISISSNRIPLGGTAMFALLAMSGDIGGSIGPTIVGRAADLFDGDLQKGILFGSIFPIILLIAVIAFIFLKPKKTKEENN